MAIGLIIIVLQIVRHNFLLLIFSIPLNVSFEETVYEVVERNEIVEVCLNLTQPDYDILDNSINIEVFVDDYSISIPSNVYRASKLTITVTNI